MVGSIIQAARGLLKDIGKQADQAWEESEKSTVSKDDSPITQANQKAEAELKAQPTEQPKEEPTPVQDEQGEAQETVEEKVEDKDENKANKILSDEKTKNIDSEDKGDTAGKVFSIVQGVRKDIASIGDALKGKSSGQPVGTNTYNAASQVYKSSRKPKDYVAKSEPTPSTKEDVPSDECLKQFFYNDDNQGFYDSDILDAYKRLNVITFTYKPEATEIDPTQDTETVHTGLKAQEIEAQPELASAVKEDPESGYKMVDTRELTMQNAAAISEIAKLLDDLKTKVEQLGG